jgi:thiamine biosynthesis lipoprotein
MLILMILVVRYWVLLISVFLFSCQNVINQSVIIGETQGTTYTIKYNAHIPYIITKNQIDSLLRNIDISMSTYNPKSIISSINRGEDVLLDSLITIVIKKAISICYATDGMFDVTVSPIVNDWGFGPGAQKMNLTQKYNIEEYSNIVGCDKIIIEDNKLIKEQNITIDLNGIAQGFTVDYLADYLINKDVSNFMIEVGGEVRCSGFNFNNPWKIAIDKPTNKSRGIVFVLGLNNLSLATSGSYRKFYYNEESIKISHTINPKTLSPAKNKLISVTILHQDCMVADAYATACMSLGLSASKLFLDKTKVSACLIYVENKDTMYHFSNQFSSFLHFKPGSAPQ